MILIHCNFSLFFEVEIKQIELNSAVMLFNFVDKNKKKMSERMALKPTKLHKENRKADTEFVRCILMSNVKFFISKIYIYVTHNLNHITIIEHNHSITILFLHGMFNSLQPITLCLFTKT